MMNKSRLVFAVVTPALLASAALAALEACASDSSSSSSSGAGPTPEAGKDVNPGDTSLPDTFVPPVADAGSDCGKAAKLFPPKPDGGIFCPFSATAAGGKDIYCLNTEQCFENVKGAGPSTCVAKGTACPVATATVWECEDPVNCVGGVAQKCCAHSSAGGTVTVATDTCGPYLTKFSGTKCAATCAAGELVVCEQQSECTTGTCTAVKPKGNDIGVCQ